MSQLGSDPPSSPSFPFRLYQAFTSENELQSGFVIGRPFAPERAAIDLPLARLPTQAEEGALVVESSIYE